MLEVLVCDDVNITKELYASNNIVFSSGDLAIRAMAGDECLGFCLFAIAKTSETVYLVEPKDDIMLADGLLRSALHVGTERGVTEAFYSNVDYESLYEKINFLEDKTEKRLKLQNLFSGCCSCAGK